MTRRALLMVSLAACGEPAIRGPIPTLERALSQAGYRDVRTISYGDLTIVLADRALYGAGPGCVRRSCATSLGTTGEYERPFSVAPFVVDGWFMISIGSRSPSGWGDSARGLVVHAGERPRAACDLQLSSHGCSQEYGDCVTVTADVLPGAPGTASFVLRLERHGDEQYPNTNGTRCTRYELPPTGTCTSHEVPC